MTHGRNLIVALDGVPVAAAKSCKINLSQNFINVCSPTEGRVLEKEPTTYDWSVSVDCLVASSDLPNNLIDILRTGTKCLLTFTDSSNQKRAGFVYVKACDEGGTVGSLATFSASFESSGKLYKYEQYTTQAFTEGANKIVKLDHGVVTITTSSGSQVYGAEIPTTHHSGTLYGFVSNWTAYSLNLSEAKTAISSNNADTLDDNHIGGGQSGSGTVTIPMLQRKYTILSQVKAVFLLLY